MLGSCNELDRGYQNTGYMDRITCSDPLKETEVFGIVTGKWGKIKRDFELFPIKKYSGTSNYRHSN
jgi:hypothetical protein